MPTAGLEEREVGKGGILQGLCVCAMLGMNLYHRVSVTSVQVCPSTLTSSPFLQEGSCGSLSSHWSRWVICVTVSISPMGL